MIRKAYRKMEIKIFILIGGLLVLSITGAACGLPSFSRETQEQLDAALDDTMSQAKAPGALTGIWAPEGDWVVAKGKADVESGSAMKTIDVIRIGSITKTFTATLVLQLVDDGKVGLEDKIAEYVPDFPNGDRITIRQLLCHTSGIQEWAEDDELRRDVLENPESWDVDKMIDTIGQKPLLFEPGADFSYSNVDYFLLGKVIEKVSGKTVRENIQERIAEPLGLKNTFLPEGPTYEGDVVHGYEESDGEIADTTGSKTAEIVNYDLAYTAGGMVRLMTFIGGRRRWLPESCSVRRCTRNRCQRISRNHPVRRSRAATAWGSARTMSGSDTAGLSPALWSTWVTTRRETLQ